MPGSRRWATRSRSTYLALSYDHRIVDGRDALTFLVRIKGCVEEPSRILFDI